MILLFYYCLSSYCHHKISPRFLSTHHRLSVQVIILRPQLLYGVCNLYATSYFDLSPHPPDLV